MHMPGPDPVGLNWGTQEVVTMVAQRETEALVVGAGPVGLFSALCLTEQGVGVQIVDKDWRTTVHSYALAIHPATLRLLDELGLAGELIEHGYRVNRIGIYRGETRLGEIDLSSLEGPYPFVLVVPQSGLEGALEKRLEGSGVKVLWNHKVMALEPGPDGAVAEVARMDRVASGYPVARTEWVITKTSRTRADYVVGADGYDSMTRRALGAEYADLGNVETFAVFEFPSPLDLEGEVRLVLGDDTSNVLWPMTGGRARWSFQVHQSPAGKLDLEALHEKIRDRAPWFQPLPSEVQWTTTIWFERRLADRFGADRVWLAGDSAHLTGPAGVQSMNIGLREARDLADAVAGALRGGSEEKLHVYARERQREWRRLLGIEGRLSAAEGAPDWAVENGSRLVPCIPAAGADLDLLLRQVGLEIV
jgi:2-polyprenyl-6-methoxyphenol hydroxylase-like FAD-dependent oxidoreductase